VPASLLQAAADAVENRGLNAERERTVVLLSFYADKSADDAGRELALAPGNVRVIRHRALGKLRACMGLE